jgi:hypothetical protein
VGLGHIFPNRILTCHLSSLTLDINFHSIETADDQRAMYDGFSEIGAHYVKWFEIAKNFLMLAFASDHREAKCLCNRCQSRRMLFEYEISGHISKNGFIPNYLVWHQHEEVQAPVATESDGRDDEDRMDGMIYDLGKLGLETLQEIWPSMTFCFCHK